MLTTGCYTLPVASILTLPVISTDSLSLVQFLHAMKYKSGFKVSMTRKLDII